MSSESIRIPVVTCDGGRDLIPHHAETGDAACDVRAASSVTIAPGERAVVPCGIRIAIPEGYAGLVVPRSGLAARSGITVLNSPGLIDSGYRGEVKAILLNTDAEEPFVIEEGDRIAQLMFIKACEPMFYIVEELDETARGDSGLGSTGVR